MRQCHDSFEFIHFWCFFSISFMERYIDHDNTLHETQQWNMFLTFLSCKSDGLRDDVLSRVVTLLQRILGGALSVLGETFCFSFAYIITLCSQFKVRFLVKMTVLWCFLCHGCMEYFCVSKESKIDLSLDENRRLFFFSLFSYLLLSFNHQHRCSVLLPSLLPSSVPPRSPLWPALPVLLLLWRWITR